MTQPTRPTNAIQTDATQLANALYTLLIEAHNTHRPNLSYPIYQAYLRLRHATAIASDTPTGDIPKGI